MWKLSASHAAIEAADLSAEVDLTRPQAGIKVTSLRVGQEGSFGGHDSQFGPQFGDAEFLRLHFPDAHLPEQIEDSWVRGDDIVAVYPATVQRTVRPEIYWRHLQLNSRDVAGSESGAAGLELIASVQTGLLDADATISVSTKLQVDEIVWLVAPEHPQEARVIRPGSALPSVDGVAAQGIFVFRPPASTCSYIEMVFPSDFGMARLDWETARASGSESTLGPGVRGIAELHSRLFPESLEKGVIRRARVRGLFVRRENDLATAAQLFAEFSTSPLPLTT